MPKKYLKSALFLNNFRLINLQITSTHPYFNSFYVFGQQYILYPIGDLQIVLSSLLPQLLLQDRE